MHASILSIQKFMTATALVAVVVTATGCGPEREDPGVRVSGVQTTSAPPPVMVTPAVVAPETTTIEVAEPPAVVSFEEGESAFHARNYDEARRNFSLYTEAHEANPWGHYMLGLSAWKSGDFAGAEAAFQRAIVLDARHVKSWLNLSRVRLDDGRPEDALTSLDAAQAIDDTTGELFRLKGRAYYALGRTEDAEGAYRQALVLDPEDAWSMNNLALIQIESGNFDAALPMLALAVSLRDDIAVFENNLGMALEHTGHHAAAREAYEQATSIDAGYERAANNLARVERVPRASDSDVDLTALADAFRGDIEGGATTEVADESVGDVGAEVEAAPVMVAPATPEEDDMMERTIAASDTSRIGIE